MAEQVEICCPSCQSRFGVPWVQGSYAAVCMNCGKGIADLRPFLTQGAPADASVSSANLAGQALRRESGQPGNQTASLAALVGSGSAPSPDDNAPTVYGEKPVTDTEQAPPGASTPTPLADQETMKVPREVAAQPTKALPRTGSDRRDPASATAFGTGKLKLGRVGHSLTGETRVRRRERLERGKKKVFESWVAPPGALMPAGNSGHFAPPTASGSKTRAISYRDLRSSSSTAYLDSLRSAAEAARVKKGISRRLLPQIGAANEVAELERFLEQAEQQESGRHAQAKTGAGESPGTSGTLSDLSFKTNITKEVVVARAPEPVDDKLPVDAAEGVELGQPRSEGSLPPAAVAAAQQAAAAVAPRDEMPPAHMHIIHRSAAEAQEANDPGERRVATRTVIAKETEIKLRTQAPPRLALSGTSLFALAMYLLMFLGVVGFALMIVNQYLMDLGLPRIR